MFSAQSLIDLIFPRKCVGCHKELSDPRATCEECFSKIPVHTYLHCGKCNARIPQNLQKKCHRDFPFVIGYATSYSNEIARELVHVLKFKFVEDASADLARLIIQHLEGAGIDLRKNFLIVPVPLHAKREIQRGYNQSERIAKHIALHFNLPLEKDVIQRTKPTHPQSDTPYEERRKNLEGAFVAKSVSDKSILLIDDVITSGATLEEAARMLKKEGAKMVLAITALSAKI